MHGGLIPNLKRERLMPSTFHTDVFSQCKCFILLFVNSPWKCFRSLASAINAPIFESRHLYSLFLERMYIFRIVRSRSYSRITGSTSRSHEQNQHVYVCCSGSIFRMPWHGTSFVVCR